MNSLTKTRYRLAVLFPLCVGYVVGWSVAHGEPTADATPATTNASAGTNIVRLSKFDADLPSGKDPFFPRSTRRAMEGSSHSSNVADTSTLLLQGVSRGGAHAFATINNRTFETGEEGEVQTPNGRFRIRCEEIKPQSVVISIGGTQRLELRLPQR